MVGTTAERVERAKQLTRLCCLGVIRFGQMLRNTAVVVPDIYKTQFFQQGIGKVKGSIIAATYSRTASSFVVGIGCDQFGGKRQ